MVSSSGEGEAQRRASAAYDLASDHFDHPALSFWDRFGRATVDHLDLDLGARVLDVCCGSGASALPAARAVGPSGRVLGIDLSESLLALGRTKAGAQGLDNMEFQQGDLLHLPLPEQSFDAVVCVFGIFFLPDVPAAVAALWRMVRPGGQLAITTWGQHLFEPAVSLFWEAVQAERPDLVRVYEPWNRIVLPDQLRATLTAGGVDNASVTEVNGAHPIDPRADWWPIILGSGYRATVDQLTPDAADRVRARCIEGLLEAGASAIQVNTLFALARR